MAPEVWFEPEKEEFNLYIDNKEVKNGGKFKKIKWKQNQLELFKRFKAIKQDIWIQIYDVYLDKFENVIGLGFRITPEASFYHEYPDIDFDINGFISGDLEAELKDIKTSSQKWYKLVKNFYKILINLQKERERTDVVNNIQICLKIIKLDENNFDFNMQLYVNLNTCKILVNNNIYFYNSKILINCYFNKFYFIFGFFKF